METKYTASVVGCGAGGSLSIDALLASDRFTLRAVADLSTDALERVQQAHPGVETYNSYLEMFSACPTEVVCVSTYAPSHLPIVKDALGRDELKGLLVEKPVADSVQNALLILQQIRSRGIPVVVPHGLLVAKHSTEILSIVRNGAIGRLELVEMQCDKWDLINAGIHWFNFFVALTPDDPVVSVHCACDSSTGTYRDGLQVETESVTYAVTRSGVRAVLHTGDYVQTIRKGKGVFFRLVADAGTIEFYGWESSYRLRNREYPEGRFFEVTPSKSSNHQIHLENLSHMIDENAVDYSLISSSIAALEICEAAYASGDHHCKVLLPLAQFAPRTFPGWRPGLPYTGNGGGRNGRTLPQNA